MNKPFLKRFPRVFFSSLWALGIFGLFVFDFSETTKDFDSLCRQNRACPVVFVQTGLLLWELNFRNLTSTSIPVGRLFIWSVSLPFLYGVFDRAYSTFSTLPGS